MAGSSFEAGPATDSPGCKLAPIGRDELDGQWQRPTLGRPAVARARRCPFAKQVQGSLGNAACTSRSLLVERGPTQLRPLWHLSDLRGLPSSHGASGVEGAATS